MSQLHQMQLSYVPTEDRILFRINTKARQEFRFWMTRRYTSVLWEAIANLLKSKQAELPAEETSPQKDPVMNKLVRDELLKSAEIAEQHKEHIQNSDFQTAYQESQYLPLGKRPVVLFGVGIKPGSHGQPLLCVHPKNGNGIELALNDQIIHSLCKLISDAATKAQWNLDLRLIKNNSEKLPEGLN